MHRATVSTVVWLALLCLAAIGLTIASFYAFLIPEYRGITFYSVIASTCAAELVLFAYLGYVLTVPHTVKRPSPAVRMRILALVVLWFLVILVSGSVAAHPSQADSFYSDKILVFQSILTFLLLLGAYFFHRQDVLVQVRHDEPLRQRVHLQSYAVGIDELADVLRSATERHPAGALELDRLAKRLDTLKSQLMSVSPVAEREPARLVAPLNTEQIEERLREVHDRVRRLAEAGDDVLGEHLVRARQSVDALLGLLRRREEVTAF